MKNIYMMLIMVLLLRTSVVNAQENTIVINADQGKHIISRHIYGHFAEHLGRCIYGGIWVGEESSIPNTRGIRNDVVKALREIKIPNIRWPGGCFADTYHWKDGIGPEDQRPEIVNIHWGNVTEDNSFGTHEFMELCDQLDCEPYICGNLGSGTVQEMAEWIEYLTSPAQSPMTRLRKEYDRDAPWQVKYWGLGNESWGCGGRMSVEYYVDKAANYSVFCRNYPGNELYKIACGGYADRGDYHWTEVLMRDGLKRIRLDAHAIHYYSNGTIRPRRTAADFDEEGWFDIIRANLKMEKILKQNIAIMDRYDPPNTVDLIVDEWGNWFEVEPGTNPRFLYQQNTLRDAIGAALQLNIFNNYCERVKMTNIAQTVNVLQAMLLTQDEKMVKTPTYYVYKMFTVHHDAILLPLDLACKDYVFKDDQLPVLNASASIDTLGKIHISVVNIHPHQNQNISCSIRGKKITKVTSQIISADKMNSFNDFDQKEKVNIKEFNKWNLRNNQINIDLPAKSIVVLELE